AQLCTHVLLLREHGYTCDRAYIYFAGDRRRVTITVDDQLVAVTLDAIARVRSVAAAPEPPPPLEDSPKCRGCSLVLICLPDEVQFLRQATLADGAEPGRTASVDEVEPDRTAMADGFALRRLHPARDD